MSTFADATTKTDINITTNVINNTGTTRTATTNTKLCS